MTVCFVPSSVFGLCNNKMKGIAVGIGMSLYQLHARGRSQRGCNSRKDGNNGL